MCRQAVCAHQSCTSAMASGQPVLLRPRAEPPKRSLSTGAGALLEASLLEASEGRRLLLLHGEGLPSVAQRLLLGLRLPARRLLPRGLRKGAKRVVLLRVLPRAGLSLHGGGRTSCEVDSQGTAVGARANTRRLLS